ncbi:MAG TPA: protein kinase [Acidimicrobiales bacterium]|jgi:serine/threonine-protein kinase|nr:protein kinase [Acidimicrobiales bacterium]MDP6213736.1 protein kinase [Acidimicrobiales bacterium]MDP7209886.1 protein kinase [Acidimicrobiales bacterium]HJL88971.1 protein kinase [Acidimicrobiales bacterium]HJO99240.1 protein kinase [Acidimicrobiales bacterium]|tara:strand:+ start:17759 stop:19633 length:1875 start_codon:yes stop_codon:yes gene_type:complete
MDGQWSGGGTGGDGDSGGPASSSPIGQLVDGRYRLSEAIGTGGSGTVYLAEDISLGRRVAVKVLHTAASRDPAFVRQFRAEAQAVASLKSPHVVDVYDWGVDGQAYLVTEYLGGGSLRSILASGRTLSPSQVLVLALDACRGLDHAHSKGLVHRDVKPANLLFGDDGRLRIADFGLAAAMAGEQPGSGHAGTARYASPEQARGKVVDGRSDVYALALCMVEAVTGHLPFVESTVAGTLRAREGRDVPVPDVLGPLAPVVARAGAAHPDKRPTVAEFGRMLLSMAEGMSRPEPLQLVGPGEIGASPLAGEAASVTPSVFPDAVPAPPQRPVGPRRRWPAAVLTVALVVGAVVGGTVLWENTRDVTRRLPSLVGSSGESAGTLLTQLGWVVEERFDRQDGSVQGELLEMIPAGGTALAEGEAVVIVISLGADRVAVPTGLVGVTASEAARLLDEAGLTTGEVTRGFSEETLPGLVIEVPGAASSLPLGTAVDLVLSEGPAPRSVPTGLMGMHAADVQASLLALKLLPVLVDSPGMAEVGTVVGVSPEPGTPLAVGGEIQVLVSSGPEPRPVPAVEGLSVVAADARLQAAGFRQVEVEGPADGRVTSQDPASGYMGLPQTRVTLISK